MLERLKQLPELRDVASDQQVLGLQTRLVLDRDTIARLGITPAAIDQTLYDAYGQRQVSTMFTQLNQYHVVLELLPGFMKNPMELRSLFVRSGMGGSGSTGVVAGGSATNAFSGPTSSSAIASASAALGVAGATSANASAQVFGGGSIASTAAFPNGSQVPLSAFATFETRTVPITVNHQGQFPVVTLSFNLAPNASLGDAVEAVNRVKTDLGMPASIQAAFQGTAQAFRHRWQMSLSLFLPRSSPSTLCWACCMKATFTPSRFCLLFLRRVLAPCWRFTSAATISALLR
jgi:multidrug efflux pump